MKITTGNHWFEKSMGMKSIIFFNVMAVYYPQMVFSITILNFGVTINFSVKGGRKC